MNEDLLHKYELPLSIRYTQLFTVLNQKEVSGVYVNLISGGSYFSVYCTVCSRLDFRIRIYGTSFYLAIRGG
jgi:hypothetical protein